MSDEGAVPQDRFTEEAARTLAAQWLPELAAATRAADEAWRRLSAITQILDGIAIMYPSVAESFGDEWPELLPVKNRRGRTRRGAAREAR